MQRSSTARLEKREARVLPDAQHAARLDGLISFPQGLRLRRPGRGTAPRRRGSRAGGRGLHLSRAVRRCGAADAHQILLGRGIPIVEGLDLRPVQAGDYDVIVLPLKVRGHEGAPARAIMRALAAR